MNIDKYKILINPYNREYKILDTLSSEIIDQSYSPIQINNVDDYYSFVSNISHMSNVYYNVTKICNLKCPYCYSKNGTSYVSIKDNRIILDKLELLNTRSIILIGGEPLCHPHINDILAEILERSFEQICIITNGTKIHLLDKDYLKDPRIYLQISLDGYNEETNAPTRGRGVFKKVEKNINYLINNKINFRVMKVLTRDNIGSSLEYFKHFYDKGIASGFFMVKQVEDNLKPSLAQLEQLAFDIYDIVNKPESVFDVIKFADNLMFENTGFPIAHCGAGIISVSIDPNGDVYPCVKRTLNKNFITNIYNSDSTDEIDKYRKNIIKNELVFEKSSCIKCDISYFCGGGCRAEEVDGLVCKYNCEYFKLAFNIYYKLKLCSIVRGILKE